MNPSFGSDEGNLFFSFYNNHFLTFPSISQEKSYGLYVKIKCLIRHLCHLVILVLTLQLVSCCCFTSSSPLVFASVRLSWSSHLSPIISASMCIESLRLFSLLRFSLRGSSCGCFSFGCVSPQCKSLDVCLSKSPCFTASPPWARRREADEVTFRTSPTGEDPPGIWCCVTNTLCLIERSNVPGTKTWRLQNHHHPSNVQITQRRNDADVLYEARAAVRPGFCSWIYGAERKGALVRSSPDASV